MELLNKVELIGIVGSVKMSRMGETLCARLSVVTNYSHRDSRGCAVVETTWHNVVAFDGSGDSRLERIGKGDCLRVLGRLRNVRFREQDGTERCITEIMADALEIIYK